MRLMRITALQLLLAASVASATTYTVTSTADTGAGSLRQAILDANASLGLDTIAFNIIGSGVHTIVPATPLPPITDAVTIDGYTQPGSSANTNAVGLGLNTVLRIEIAGTGTEGNGLDVRATGVAVRGLVVNRFSQNQVEGNSQFDHTGLVVEGCFLGTSPDGLQAYSGGGAIGSHAPNLRIGGLTPAARNLISLASSIASSSSGVVQGNLIGTDLGGARGIAGGGAGVGIAMYSSGAVLIGGTDPNAPNVIAGLDIGISINSATATIQGNFIGVDAAQAGVISGGEAGIKVPGLPAGSTIGGTGPGEGNVIGGFDHGIFLDSRAAPIYGNFIGTDTTATKNFGNRIMGIYLRTSLQVVGGVGAGEGNVIAFNGWVGILVNSGVQNPIRGNRIFNNGIGGVGTGVGLAIDLDLDSTPNGQNPNDLGDADSAGNGFGNDFQNYPLITSAVPEGGGTRVIGTLNSLASTVFDLDFYSNPSCRGRPRAPAPGGDVHRLDAGHDGRLGKRLLQRPSLDSHRGRRARHRVGHRADRKHLRALAGDHFPVRSGRRRARGHRPAVRRRTPVRSGGDHDDRREPGSRHVQQRAQARFRRPLPLPGRRLRHRRDQSRRPFGHASQWLRLPLLGRGAHVPL